MVSARKYSKKKVLITIIVAVLVYIILSFVATKLIYDSTFARYDCANVSISDELLKTREIRQHKSYKSGENLLSGYLYKSSAQNVRDALIVICAGHNACSDSYLAQIDQLLALGWSVFSYDASGCCTSQGKSARGFPQAVCDLEATLNYIEKEKRFGYNDIVLLGHSQGGYAVCCMLYEDFDISAVISVSAVNSAMDGVMSGSSQYVGKLAYANYGFLWGYQAMLFGSDLVNLRADRALSQSDVPTLVIHGENDEIVPTNQYSLISYREQIKGDNVEYVIFSKGEASGHTNILFDSDKTANDELITKIDNFLNKNIK